ncbi:MAG TPA: MFS transporter, partial [Herpetosiphonaceae bacterium]|nr:MFS transporter [Herpetosiphonaceae bacterium]
APAWGRLGDRWGRKKMVIRALLGLSATLLLMGLVRTPGQFLLVRLFQGAFGGVVDAGAAFVGSQAPEDVRGKVFGKLEGAVAGGSLFGPLVGGLLVDVVGFRPVLLLMGGLTALLPLAAAWLLHEDREPERAETQIVPAAGRTTLATAKGLFLHPKTGVFLVAGLCVNLGVYGLVTVFAPFVERVAGDPRMGAGAATWVGVLQAVTWGSAWIGSSWWGKRNDRAPVELNFFWAALACGAAIMLQSVATQIGWIVALRVVQGFCFSALLQSVFLVVSNASAEHDRGFRMGLTSSILVIGQIGGGLGAAWAGRFAPVEFVIAATGMALVVAALAIKVARPAAPRVAYRQLGEEQR